MAKAKAKLSRIGITTRQTKLLPLRIIIIRRRRRRRVASYVDL
jgi:hypothetical protein